MSQTEISNFKREWGFVTLELEGSPDLFDANINKNPSGTIHVRTE